MAATIRQVFSVDFAKSKSDAQALKRAIVETMTATKTAAAEAQKAADGVAQAQRRAAVSIASIDRQRAAAHAAALKQQERAEAVAARAAVTEARQRNAAIAALDRQRAAAHAAALKQQARDEAAAARSRNAVAGGLGRAAGFAAGVVGIGGAALITREAIGAVIEYDSALANVAKTTGATDAEMLVLNRGFRDLALEIPKSASELANIGALAGQLGIQNRDLLGFTRTVADLAVAVDGIDAEEAAAGLAKIGNITGGATAANIERMGSALVALGNDGASTEGHILQLATRIAAASDQAGLGQPLIFGYAAAMANLGIEAEAGGTAFSKTLRDISAAVAGGGRDLDNFAKVAGQTGDAFARLFRDSPQQAIEAFLVGLRKIKEGGGDVGSVLAKLGIEESRQIDALTRLSKATIVAGDGTTALGRTLATASAEYERNAALTEEAERKYQSIASQLTIFRNSLEEIALAVGQETSPAFVDLVQGATEVARSIGEAIPDAINDLMPGLTAIKNEVKDFFLALTGGEVDPTTTFAEMVGGFVRAWAEGFSKLELHAQNFFSRIKLFALEAGQAIADAVTAPLRGALDRQAGYLRRFGLGGGVADTLSALGSGIGARIDDATQGRIDQLRRAIRENEGTIAGISAFRPGSLLGNVRQEVQESKRQEAAAKTAKAAEEDAAEAARRAGLLREKAAAGVAAAKRKETAEVNKLLKAFEEEEKRAQRFAELNDSTIQQAGASREYTAAFEAAMHERAKLLDEAEQHQVEVAREASRARLALFEDEMHAKAQLLDELAEQAKATAADIGGAVAQLAGGGGLGAILGPLAQRVSGSILGDGTSGARNALGGVLKGGLGAALGAGGNAGNRIGAGIGGAVGSGISSVLGSKAVTGALTGAFGKTVGGALGAALPGIGAVIGPLLGNFLGRVFGGTPAWQKAQKSITNRLGTTVSQGVGEAIIAIKEQVGGDVPRAVRETLGLDLILKEATIGAGNASKFAAEFEKLADLSAGVGKTADYAKEHIGPAYENLHAQLVAVGIDGQASLKAINDQAKELAKTSPEIQRTFTAAFSGGAAGLNSLFALGASKDYSTDFLQAGPGSLLGAFSTDLLAGLRTVPGAAKEILGGLGENLDALVKRAKEAGIALPEGVLGLLGEREFYKANEQLLSAIDGTAQFAREMGNVGFLGKQSFEALEGQIGIFQQDLAGAGKTGQDALSFLAPTLQEVINASLREGYTIDANTQSLIDQAAAFGLVKVAGTDQAAAQKASNDYLLGGFAAIFGKQKELASYIASTGKTAIDTAAQVAAGTAGIADHVVASAQRGVGGVLAQLQRLRAEGGGPISLGDIRAAAGGEPRETHAAGGPVFTRRGVVSQGEVVFSRPDVQRHGGVAAVEALRTGSGGGGGGQVINISIDARGATADAAQAIAQAVRRVIDEGAVPLRANRIAQRGRA